MFSRFIRWCFFLVLCAVIPEAVHSMEFNTLYHPDLRQDVFIKDEFHYLNVPRIGTYTVYDIFDCSFECLSNPSCLSLNLAASKGADGKMWCELLSSTKFNKSEEFKANESAHHFSIKTPCLSSPCQSGGTCVPNYKYHTFRCSCMEGFLGKHCEIARTSCTDLYNADKSSVSQVVTLILDSKPTSVLCHMGDFGCGDGGWTPVMKIDGSKRTFHYTSSFWSNKETLNLAGGKTGFDNQETKLPTYWKTSFSKICLGMKIHGEEQTNFIVINKTADSLYSLIADGPYRNTSLGLDTWKKLIGSQASLQTNCQNEGFNAIAGHVEGPKARVGIIGNENNDCYACDSRIGFGTGGTHDDNNTCGNEATHSPDNGEKHIKAMGFILVK